MSFIKTMMFANSMFDLTESTCQWYSIVLQKHSCTAHDRLSDADYRPHGMSYTKTYYHAHSSLARSEFINKHTQSSCVALQLIRTIVILHISLNTLLVFWMSCNQSHYILRIRWSTRHRALVGDFFDCRSEAFMDSTWSIIGCRLPATSNVIYL